MVSLPNKTSIVPDQISYSLLKEAGPGVAGPLTTLFYLSITLNKIPDEWKKAIVFPVFKGGRKNRQNPGSYRPISLTSCVARTMEKLVNGQVLNNLSTNSLLYGHQSGFLPKHSTVTQLCYLSNQWQMALEKGEEIHAVFLDLKRQCHDIQWYFALFARAKYGYCSRKCHGNQLGQPRDQLHRPNWVEQMLFSSSNCRFPRPCLVAAIIFPHKKWLLKITDYRDTAALKMWGMVL